MANVLPRELNKLDKIEPEFGTLKVTAADGKVVRLTIKEAIQRAIGINAMPMNTKEEHRVKMILVDQIKIAIQKAKSQIENPSTKLEALTINVLSGKDEKGNKVQDTMDGRLRYYLIKYPTVDEKEALRVLEMPGITAAQVDDIMGALHRTNGEMYLPGGAIHNKVMSSGYVPQTGK
jgi:hypothetical protein